MDKKSFIYNFIANHKLAVISTQSADSKPQSAVIGFGQTKNLEIIFGTDSSSRKYNNILNNPAVSLVIGWDDNKTVQLEGNAQELSENDLELIRQNYWNKSPDAESYHKNPGQRYFVVKPMWVRYTDLDKEPWEIIALEF
jgi:general stress protein 26